MIEDPLEIVITVPVKETNKEEAPKDTHVTAVTDPEEVPQLRPRRPNCSIRETLFLLQSRMSMRKSRRPRLQPRQWRSSRSGSTVLPRVLVPAGTFKGSRSTRLFVFHTECTRTTTITTGRRSRRVQAFLDPLPRSLQLSRLQPPKLQYIRLQSERLESYRCQYIL